MTIIAKVNSQLFAAAHNFINQNGWRLDLKGVAIQKHPDEGVLLIGTDRTRLFIAHDKDGKVDSDIIVKIGKKLLKEAKTPNRDLLIDDNAETSIHERCNSKKLETISCDCLIDAIYANWRKLTYFQKPKHSVCVDPILLSGFCDVAKNIAGGRIYLEPIMAGSTQSTFIKFGSRSDCFGVLANIASDRKPNHDAFISSIIGNQNCEVVA